MRVLFQVDLIFPAGGRGTPHAFFRKETDLDFPPQPAVPVEHPTWHDPRHILTMSLNLEDQSYLVALTPEQAHNQQECDALIKMYKSHEWSVHPDD